VGAATPGLVPLTRGQLAEAAHLLPPERPGPMIARHLLGTGNGSCLADRWPGPRALAVATGGNWALAGDPAPSTRCCWPPPGRPRAARVATGDFTLEGPGDPPPGRRGAPGVRRLGPGDAGPLAGLGAETDWIASTWGGPGGWPPAAPAWGAFDGRRLVAVACPFFVGQGYEDLGVATGPGFRGLGLSPACAWAVCQDVRRRGRVPSWTTSPDNTASLRVAARLGFRRRRRDRLLVVDAPVPEPARPPQP
jgi:RimJ/RimL family protein N-acetyltransferase